MPNLHVANNDVWLNAFGVAPGTEHSSGDEFVQELRIPVAADEVVHVTWDTTDDSIRLRHWRDGHVITDLFREAATLLTVWGRGTDSEVVIEYGTSGLTGRLRCRTHPEVVIGDDLLRA